MFIGELPEGTTPTWLIPLWFAAEAKPWCNWGFAGLVSAEVDPSTIRATTVFVSLAAEYQPNDACARSP